MKLCHLLFCMALMAVAALKIDAQAIDGGDVSVILTTPSHWSLMIAADGSGQVYYGTGLGHGGMFTSGTFAFDDVSKKLQSGSVSGQYDNARKERTQIMIQLKGKPQFDAFFNDNSYVAELLGSAVKHIAVDRNNVSALVKERPFF